MAITASYISKVTFNRKPIGGAFAGEQTLNGINDISIGLNSTLVDISAMDGSSDFTKRLRALKDFPLTVSGFFDPADAAYVYLQADFTAGSDALSCKVYYTGAAGFEIYAIVESIDFSASVDGAMEVSISLQSNGNISVF